MKDRQQQIEKLEALLKKESTTPQQKESIKRKMQILKGNKTIFK